MPHTDLDLESRIEIQNRIVQKSRQIENESNRECIRLLEKRIEKIEKQLEHITKR